MSGMKLPRAVSDLVTSFEKLPGVGPKSAQRLVFYLLHNPDHELETFAANLLKLKKNTILCEICHNVSESNPCPVCADHSRDDTLLCVVEQPLDVLAIERSGAFNGRYHVLHGVIAPLSNIGPDQLYLHDISKRLEFVEEVVLATNPTMEGEATALYITEYLQQQGKLGAEGTSISRIGHGLPIGADIEYADGMTLTRALEGRRKL
ncbi:MAG: recombination protein RecR [Candidatus Pacebacteria bacterium]|nr:recombination protein RecR [Candidatus Paceibacterota bacterium]PIR63273.1 MAG: recombination protein RecR [Candidatus Pacebacteria bacterium CG10_big_fil_rev_8_21_14_0_10_40_26]PIZ79154.1 MAG: recombination protein RecR [Candidatus Pacebacteria bacterium CG_4_10_14_0_2_um_filter_40_20]PJA68809.1 MAG: recombination protein RecR [Candidatus Pacebacteria bacterium CG_4_9_14_3_um_filter_40_12]PJC42120.1 MAG: recombination protein RecR [Candidatus Pacebacteria bacterium CG_4_9_14_0_2_um_filter_4